MLVSFVKFQPVFGSNSFLAQITFKTFLVHIDHVLHVAVFLLEHFMADLALLSVVLVVGVVVAVLFEILLGLELLSAQLADVDGDRQPRLGRVSVHDVPGQRLLGDETLFAIFTLERPATGVLLIKHVLLSTFTVNVGCGFVSKKRCLAYLVSPDEVISGQPLMHTAIHQSKYIVATCNTLTQAFLG